MDSLVRRVCNANGGLWKQYVEFFGRLQSSRDQRGRFKVKDVRAFMSRQNSSIKQIVQGRGSTVSLFWMICPGTVFLAKFCEIRNQHPDVSLLFQTPWERRVGHCRVIAGLALFAASVAICISEVGASFESLMDMCELIMYLAFLRGLLMDIEFQHWVDAFHQCRLAFYCPEKSGFYSHLSYPEKIGQCQFLLHHLF